MTIHWAKPSHSDAALEGRARNPEFSGFGWVIRFAAKLYGPEAEPVCGRFRDAIQAAVRQMWPEDNNTATVFLAAYFNWKF